MEGTKAAVPAVSDDALLARFRGGQREAFTELMRRYQRPVFRFIARLLGNRIASEDATQEVFLRVLRGIPWYRERSKFRTWVFTIARNLCVDILRKARLRGRVVLTDREQPVGRTVEIVARPLSPEERASHGEARAEIVRALESLPAAQREVFVLREYEGLRFREIGEMLGCGAATAKSRMRYALQSLRRDLSAAGVV